MIPQGIIPGLPGAGQPQQQAQQFKGFGIIAAPVPVSDAALRDELLDIFGQESSFTGQTQPCFSPGMAFVFQRPNGGPEVDLADLSSSCKPGEDGRRAAGPSPSNGFHQVETRNHLAKIYEKLWGPGPSALDPGA